MSELAPPKRRNRRASVSAECDPSTLVWKKVVIPKSQDALERIRIAMKSNFLFKALDEQQTKDILDAMKECKVKAGEKVITQGDRGDYFYVIESGDYDVWKTRQGEDAPKKVFTYNGQGSFGELALMYNCPRAATVQASTEGVLWALDRESFRHIIIKSTQARREMYENFLEKVPVLIKLTGGERSKIADCLESLSFEAGETIIKQGDEGDKFFLVEQGVCVAKQQEGKEGESVEVGRMKVGDYFGERALITRERRAADVVAEGSVKVAAMGRDAFERLLGNAREIMARNILRYKSAADLAEESV